MIRSDSSFKERRSALYQGGLYPRPEEVLEVVVLLNEYPRIPPMRPRIKPRRFMDITEKTSTSKLPSFLWAALLYSSQEPMRTQTPVMVPQIRNSDDGNPGMNSAPRVVATNAVIRVNIPASIDSAKAAVGFRSTFAAKAHPDK